MPSTLGDIKEIAAVLGSEPFTLDAYRKYGKLNDARLQAEHDAKLDEYLYGHRDDA